MTRWFRRLMSVLDDAIFPRRVWCMTCEERSCGGMLCPQCRDRLTALRINDQTGDVRSAYHYRDEARTLVHALKFSSIDDVAELLADAMAEEARAMCLPPDTVVTWVTMPERRRRFRGIDHGRVLATALGQRLGLDVQQMLVRRGRAKVQHTLRAAQRRRNLQGVFGATGPVKHPVLIVDDVFTTGATMQVCSEVLREAGATRVYGLTATRVEQIFR